MFSLKFLERVFSFFKKKKLDYETISYYKVNKAVSNISPRKKEILDGQYRTLNIQGFKDELKRIPVLGKKWIADYEDCDDFARRLWGLMSFVHPNLCFGVVMITRVNDRHALNCFVDSKGDFYFVEPQTNIVYHWYYYFKVFKVKKVDLVLI